MADLEKHELERFETQGTDSPDNEKHPLEHSETLAIVDISNSQAFKGDESDGKVEWNFRKLLAAFSMILLYEGSQIPLYFTGALLPFIARDIGGAAAIGWLPVANTLAIAAICPFVGYCQDLFGKRYIALFGSALLCIGCIVLGTAKSFGAALVGEALAGAGAGMGEITGLAGLAETVPIKYRGYSIAILVAFILPFDPYILYSQLFATHSTWRWGAWISLIYNGIAFVALIFFYHPHAHVRAEGMTWQAVVKRIDFFGAFLSIVGLTLFLVALQAGGYTHPWVSAYVLCTLLIGLALIIFWVFWEAKMAKHPMIPSELFAGQRVVALAFVVSFVAGMNFFSILNFWPLTIGNVYDPKPVQIGLHGLPTLLFVTVGVIFWNCMLSVWKDGAKWILIISATILTAFGGSLAVMTPDNVVTTIILSCFATFGVGGLVVPAPTVAMIASPDAVITTCVALSISIRAVGGSIGYSIYYNVFVSKLTARLPTYVAEYAIKAGLPLAEAKTFVETFLTVPAEAAKIPGVTAEVLAAAAKGSQWAYAESLHYVWYVSIPFGVCAIIAAAFLPNIRKFQTNRIAVQL